MIVTDLFSKHLVLLLLAYQASAQTTSFSTAYPINNPNLSYVHDGVGNDKLKSTVNETELNTQENITAQFPIPPMSTNNGFNSISPAPVEEDRSKEENQDGIDEDADFKNINNQEDDLHTAATFIIGPPYYRPYSHYPINYFPRMWLHRPRYNYYRPRPVPYVRTYSHKG